MKKLVNAFSILEHYEDAMKVNGIPKRRWDAFLFSYGELRRFLLYEAEAERVNDDLLPVGAIVLNALTDSVRKLDEQVSGLAEAIRNEKETDRRNK